MEAPSKTNILQASNVEVSDRVTASVNPTRVIMHTSEPSGLGHYVSKVVLALARSGVSVVLLCPSNSEDEEDVRGAGIEVVHLAYREVTNAALWKRVVRNIYFLAKSLRIQSRLVRRGDVVHFQGMLNLPLGLVFLLLAVLQGSALVLTAHDPLPHRWRLPRVFRWIERGLLRFSYRLFDRIVVHNNAGKEVLVKEFGMKAGRVVVIPHGWYSDAGNFEMSSYPASDCLRLLAFGSIRENKGLHLLIEATQRATRDAGLPVRLTIAGRCGTSEERYWLACKQLIAANPDAIDVMERAVPEHEIAILFARHHAIVLPYTEFFSESGVATLALSHRRPIIATTQGGLGELLNQCNCGIPIYSPTVHSVAHAILEANAMGPKQLQHMGLEGNKFMRENRSWNSVVDQTKEVYAELIRVEMPDSGRAKV